MDMPFALWLTGPPASGKSSITVALVDRLRRRGIDPVVLESDTFRKYFTPHATPSEEDRILFYRGILELAAMLVDRGVPVIIDATGNRRAYRLPARELLPKFAEVFVDCPPETCAGRDPKSLYERRGLIGAEYEPPMHPEIHIRSDRESPEDSAQKILDYLITNEWIPTRKHHYV